jgi:hypothetical protein
MTMLSRFTLGGVTQCVYPQDAQRLSACDASPGTSQYGSRVSTAVTTCGGFATHRRQRPMSGQLTLRQPPHSIDDRADRATVRGKGL